jgi:PAS domain S-box-containing protein
VFAELHRKTRQLETLNRELEQRVLERTEELALKAELLLQLNVELVEKNQELDAIVHTAPDIIFSRKADGSRDYISDRFYEFTGAAQGSANGFGWLDYVHPEDKQKAMADWLLCVESGANYEAEYRMQAKDGNYRWFRARAVPIRSDGKSSSGTELVPTFTTARCWNNQFATAPPNWKRWSIEEQTNCGAFPSGS